MSERNVFLGFIIAETDRALLFLDHFWHGPDWMPKSQLETVRHDDTDETQITASKWICGQKGLTEFTEVKPEEDPDAE